MGGITKVDKFGYPLTTFSDACISAINSYYTQVLSYGRERSVILQAPVHDPNCCLANILAAHFICSTDSSLAKTHLEAARSLLVHATHYEKAVFDVVSYLISEDRDDDVAFELHLKLLTEFPKDLVSLKRAQILCFYMGRPDLFLQLVNQVLPKNQEENYLYGMLAFALLEVGDMLEAEKAANKGLVINEEDSWSQHALCHVLQYERHFQKAVEFMEKCSEKWRPLSSFMYTHNWWHVALCYLEGNGPISKVVEIYDNQIIGELDRSDAVPVEVYLNAVALLLRVYVLGKEDAFGDRLKTLVGFLSNQENWCLEWHFDVLIAWALAATGELSKGEELIRALRAKLSKMSTKMQLLMQRPLSLAEGLYEYGKSNYTAALEHLGTDFDAKDYKIIGASDEQVDIFNDVWYVTMVNAGQAEKANEAIRKRMKQRERIPYMWRLLERGLLTMGKVDDAKLAGQEAGSAKIIQAQSCLPLSITNRRSLSLQPIRRLSLGLFNLNMEAAVESDETVNIENDQSVSVENDQLAENDQMSNGGNDQIAIAENDHMDSGENDEISSVEDHPLASMGNDKMRSGENDEMPSAEIDQTIAIENNKMTSIENHHMASVENNQTDSIENNRVACVENDNMTNIENYEMTSVENEQLVSRENDQMVSFKNAQMVGVENNEKASVQNNQIAGVDNEQMTGAENDEMVGVEKDHEVSVVNDQLVSGENDQMVRFVSNQMVWSTENVGMVSAENDQMENVEIGQIVSFEDHHIENDDLSNMDTDELVHMDDNHHQLVNMGGDHGHLVNMDDNHHHMVTIAENHQLLGMDHNNQLEPIENKLLIPLEHNQLESAEYNALENMENDQFDDVETQTPSKRKKKSLVWEHFTIEHVSADCRRAYCKQCKQSFAYSTGSKVAGTSHLKRHVAKGTCSVLLRSQAQINNSENNKNNNSSPCSAPSKMGRASNGSDPPKRRCRTVASVPYVGFNPDRCRHEISSMIIMHDYPLHIVEHPGFVAFVKSLQPRFDMVSFDTVKGDCLATYSKEKQNLQKVFEMIPGKICLSLDMWGSNGTIGYIFLTGSYIDTDWKLHQKLLNVVMEPFPESDSAFSHAVASCLSDWNMEGRLFTLTLNQPRTEGSLENLRALLSIRNPLMLDGQLLVGSCLAHSLGSVAQKALMAACDTVKKVRDSVKYVKLSEIREERFLELKQQLQVPSTKNLALDDQTRWDTTYEMLIAASELREVFSCLDTTDPDYKESPPMETWKQVETLCAFLKLLFETATVLSTPTMPTTNTYFHEVWKIQLELVRAVQSEDPFLSTLAKAMKEKFDDYWESCSLVLAIAVVMDPRFKMKLVEFSFSKIYGNDAATCIKIVDDGIHELYQEYMAQPVPLTPTYMDEGNGRNLPNAKGQTGLSELGLTDFDMYIMESTSQQSRSELDQYLEESLLPRVHEFDVLGWWKINKTKYPTLSKMARDILTIPVCTRRPGSVFDTEKKRMDNYRCSLQPETVEALICAKDWLKNAQVETSNSSVKMEFPI